MSTVLYFEEAVNSCDCCGKSELNGTYATLTDDGLKHYGSVCVLTNTGKDRKTVNKEVKSHYDGLVLKACQEIRRSGAVNDYDVAVGKVNSMGLKFGKARIDFLAEAYKKKNDEIENISKKYGVKITDLTL